MQNVSNIANTPIVFVLSGKNYQIQRLNLIDLFAEFECSVKQEFMDNIVAMAMRIKDTKERVQFQRESFKDMPKGAEMSEAIRVAMDSFNGGVKLLFLALQKCNKITLEEVKDIVLDPTNSTVITNIMAYITGSDVQEEVPENATVMPEKKTVVTVA